jgi:hypothetical protein
MKILTVISNYNEEKEILNTIQDFRDNTSITSDLLVIDNSSQDSSLKLIKESGVDYLVHPVNTGGSAGVIKTSLLYAYLNDYDIYCHMDGDNQHYSSELNKLVIEIETGRADVVIGSRFILNEGFQSSRTRRMGIKIFSYLLSLVTKSKISDITSGFRAYNRKAIELFARKFKFRYDVCLQMLLIAHYAGLKIVETPAIMKPRVAGVSEINYIKAMKFPFYAITLLVAAILNNNWIRKLNNAD